MPRQFAFYGRVSTEDQQDPETSRGWQRTRAQALIEAHGQIVTEYFDIGHSRSLPWKRRTEATRLLAALKNPNRGFDAVVIGEPQRAFYGNQYSLTFPVFDHYGVGLWVPEVGGAIDPASEAHDLIMGVFGGMSKGERNRIKIRVRTAMGSQAQFEGRYLGGRPPYGYRLADAGPHPNPGKAADGKRLHTLEPDPNTAPIVQRIFTEYLAGAGLFAIAEGLTRDNIASPSAHDPARNTHRSGNAWSKSAVRAILANPRYTGYQVWNKQYKHEALIDVDDVALGHHTRQTWNSPDKWIYSETPTHPALISSVDFDHAARLARGQRDHRTTRKPHRSRNTYALKGLLYCAACHRRMQGQYNHGQAYYRCRYPQEYAPAHTLAHPSNVYLRESDVLPQLDDWLATAFTPDRREDTLARLRAAAQHESSRESEAVTAARRKQEECQRKLTQYRTALDEGASPATIAGWIAEVEAEQARAQATLRNAQTPRGHDPDAITQIFDNCHELSRQLHRADPAHKAPVYQALGVQITYDKETHTAKAQVNPQPSDVGISSCRRPDPTTTPTLSPGASNSCSELGKRVPEKEKREAAARGRSCVPVVSSSVPASTIPRVTAYDDLDAFEHLDTSPLPRRQQRILVMIWDWVLRYGYAPSTRQLGDAVGLRSSSSVSRHLTNLEEKGLLRRSTTLSRPIDVRAFLQEPPTPEPTDDSVTVPVLGHIAAGTPISADEHVEDMLRLPRELAGRSSTFGLRVRGDSMIDAAICDGDIVVVYQQPEAPHRHSFLLMGFG